MRDGKFAGVSCQPLFDRSNDHQDLQDLPRVPACAVPKVEAREMSSLRLRSGPVSVSRSLTPQPPLHICGEGVNVCQNGEAGNFFTGSQGDIK